MRCQVTQRLIQIQAVWHSDTQTTFSQILSDIEALWKFMQTRNLADDNLFGGLRIKAHNIYHEAHLYEVILSQRYALDI